MARTTRINEAGWRRFTDTVGRRAVGVGERLASSMRSKTPVRRGHRSFDTSPGPLGGTLRDSITYAVIVDGRVVEHPASPGGQQLDQSVIAEAAAAVTDGVVVVCGTASGAATGRDGYGLWVNSGTSRMAARPFAEEAFDEVSPDVPAIIGGRG